MVDINEYIHWLNQLFIRHPIYHVVLIINMAFNLGVFSVVFFNFITFPKREVPYFLLFSAGMTFANFSFSLYLLDIINAQQYHLGARVATLLGILSVYCYLIAVLEEKKSVFFLFGILLHLLFIFYDSFSVDSLSPTFQTFNFLDKVLKFALFALLNIWGFKAYKRKVGTRFAFGMGIFITISTIIQTLPPIFSHAITIAFIYPLKTLARFANTICNAYLIGYLNARSDKRAAMQQKEVIALVNEKQELLLNQKATLAEQVAKRTIELQQSNTMKDKLFATIGHDLRNAVIVLKTSLTIFDKKGKNDAQQMQKQTDGLYNTLDNLLEWSVLQLNSHVPNSKMISLKDGVEDCLDFVSQNLLQKNIRVISTVEAVEVYINEHQLSIILRNLISNAIKFTPVGGFIRIFSNTNDRYVELTIADTGIGIPPDLLASLSDNTHFKSQVGTMGEKGTGIGLKLCKELVERHQGRLEINSEINKGTSVKIKFLA